MGMPMGQNSSKRMVPRKHSGKSKEEDRAPIEGNIRPMWLECKFRTVISWEVPDRCLEESIKLNCMRKEVEMLRGKSCSTTWDLDKQQCLI